jgi:hypothetical protein
MKKFLLAALLALTALAVKSEAQNIVYQGITRLITTTGQHCGSAASCSTIATGAQYHYLTWNVTGTLSACSVRVDSSVDNITWNVGDVISAKTCTSNGNTLSGIIVPNYVRVNVTSITASAGASLAVNLSGYQVNPSGGSSGTVTNVGTSSPLTGGPITTTGTLACPSCSVTSIVSHTATFTITSVQNGVSFNVNSTGAGGQSILLPAAVPAIPWLIRIYNEDTVNWTVSGNGHSVNGFTSQVLGSNQSMIIYSGGTNYWADVGLGVTLSANGTPGLQGFLNLKSGTDTTVVDDGAGDVTINAVVPWNDLQNATNSLFINNGTNQSAFIQDGAVPWFWENETPATITVAQSSPLFTLQGEYWNGADNPDFWTFQNVLTNGLNGASTFKFLHTGTSGKATLNAPIFDTPTGYEIAGAAATGKYLRGNGTNFVSATLLYTDLLAGAARLISQTTSLGPTTIITTGGVTVQYLITGSVYCDTSSAAATVSLSVSYTDPSSTVQTISGGTATCTTLGASSLATINSVIVAKNATNITYTTVIANSPTYDVRVEVTQISTN